MKNRKRSILHQPAKVIERWARHKIFSYMPELIRLRAKLKFNSSDERARVRVLEEIYRVIKKQLVLLDGDKFTASKTIYNLALYFLIIERDIASIKWQAIHHKDEWARNFFARMLLLILHEIEIDRLAGRSLVDAMNTLDVPGDLQSKINRSLRKIRAIQKKSEKKFGGIRNAAIAHRDPDALVQCGFIQNVNIYEIFSVGAEYFTAAEDFIGCLTLLIEQSGSPRGLIKQLLSN
jgi:hypothetical protein